jgi:hypothetical protein
MRISREVLETWLNLSCERFDKWVLGQTGCSVDGDTGVIPPNRENVAVAREDGGHRYFDVRRFLLFP